MAFDRCSNPAPTADDAEPDADQAPSVIALIAGALALSTRFAQLDAQDVGEAALRKLIAAKAASNLGRIAAHDEAPLCFRALAQKLCTQWQALRDAPQCAPRAPEASGLEAAAIAVPASTTWH